MEWEVLDVVRQANHADDQLHEWMHKHGKLTNLSVCQGQHPELQTVVELPTVDVLKGILCQLVPDRSQMQTKLADVLEAELVSDCTID